MNDSEIKGKIINIIKSLGNYNKEIENDLNFFADKVFDSMVAIDYMIRIEEEFGAEMNMDIMTKYKLGKISDLTKYLSKLNKA
jgi:acyl carrier protein